LQHAESLEGLGLIYFRAGKEDKAQSLLEQAIAVDDSLWRAHNALGVIADGDHDYERALTHYNNALALNPDSDSALINRGYSMFLNDLYREAALDFYTVAKRSDNPRAWRNLAMVYARQGWYEDALETYLEVMKPAEAHNEIGAIAIDNGDIDAARHHLGEALRLSPTYFARAEKNLAELRRLSSVAGESSYSGNRQSSQLTP
ncbi:MAG: tetratricopeptide repeat protein, partial [Gammaproteobacteria bacterium]|nr:tetratricopeptide repeat protein [Gammaproteobacteria bacterium]